MDKDLESGTTYETGENGENGEQMEQAQETKDEQGRMIPYSRFQEVNAQKKAAEAALSEVVQGIVDTVPENFRSLIPDVSPAQKIVWINQAKAAGLFDAKMPTQSPDAQRPLAKPDIDLNTANPHSLMSAGYK